MLAVILFGGMPYARVAAVAATPPPTPPPIGTPATPEPNASLLPLPTGTSAPTRQPSATPSPPPNARKGIEGVWEVQLQRPTGTDYTHMKLVQTGSTISGVYLDAHNKKYPLAGSVDGEAVRMIVSMPDGTTLLLEGKLDGTTDMLGMFTTPKEQIPFTAAYRPKEKWIENVNPSPGGMGQGNGGTYTPP